MAKDILVRTRIGEKGDTGAQGEQGIQGETGADGAAGVDGIQGETGLTGEQGIQGVAGNDGSIGADGEQGEQGIQGIQGIQGETGADGEQGIQGETGADGEQGEQGIQGETGADGADSTVAGPQGEQGIQGETGLTGETGADGEDGIDGASIVSVNQVGHGFVVPTGIYMDDLGVWNAAKADNEFTLATHVVSEITGSDDFTATNMGIINIPGHGLIVDDYYYVSDVTAGAFTDVEPSLYSNPMFKVVDVDNIQAYMWRPAQTGGAVGQTGAQGIQGEQGDSGVQVVTSLPLIPDPTTLYIIVESV